MASLGLHISFPSPVGETQAPAVLLPSGPECGLLRKCGPLGIPQVSFFPRATRCLWGAGIHLYPN